MALVKTVNIEVAERAYVDREYVGHKANTGERNAFSRVYSLSSYLTHSDPVALATVLVILKATAVLVGLFRFVTSFMTWRL